MRRTWRRYGSAAVLAIGLAGLAAVPALATDGYPSQGPLEVRIFGANGGLRDFIARSSEDRLGAAALIEQITGAIKGPARPIEEAAIILPHYRIGISRLGPTFVTTPWARTGETSFIYFPGRHTSFFVVEFMHGGAAVEQRWISPSPQVTALLRRHLQGLPPIDLEPPARRATTSPPWRLALGALLLAGLSLMLFEDHERWRRIEKRRSAGKGDVNRRSEGRRPLVTRIDSPPGYARR